MLTSFESGFSLTKNPFNNSSTRFETENKSLDTPAAKTIIDGERNRSRSSERFRFKAQFVKPQ